MGAVRTARGTVGTGCSSAATKVGTGLSPQAVKNAAIARIGRSPTRRFSRMRILSRCETTPQDSHFQNPLRHSHRQGKLQVKCCRQRLRIPTSSRTPLSYLIPATKDCEYLGYWETALNYFPLTSISRRPDGSPKDAEPARGQMGVFESVSVEPSQNTRDHTSSHCLVIGVVHLVKDQGQGEDS